MRDHHGKLTFAPRLPPELTKIAFRMTFRGSKIGVEIRPERAAYRLYSGEPLDLSHHGDPFTLGTEPVILPIPGPPDHPTPQQPHGRAPTRRRPR